MSARADAAPARREAFRVLDRVERSGAWASILLDGPAGPADPRDRALVRRIVLGVLRTRSALDHAIGCCASRPAERIDHGPRLALRIAAYELLELDRVPDHAAVDDAVRLARRAAGRAAGGFVNAVGRALARAGRDVWPAPPARDDVDALACRESHPPWWVRRAVDRLGWDAACRLLAANNEEPPIALRPNLARADPTAFVAALDAAGVRTVTGRAAPDARLVVDGADRLGGPLDDGVGLPQDEASQLVGILATPKSGDVLDLCAAPGSKATQIAGALGERGRVLAADRHHGRLRRLERLRRRLGLPNVAIVQADTTRGGAPFASTFDRVLVDAPCSGTGTLRRHPEIRWRLGAEDPARLARTQAGLLDSAAELVSPGGRLVYAVCSLEPEEGEAVVAGFLQRHRDFLVEPAGAGLAGAATDLVGQDGALRTSPAVGGLDGFHAALLVRRRRTG